MTTTTNQEAPNHNTLTCYTRYKCRLPKCVDRYNTSTRTRIRAQKAGTWQRFVPAEPVRQHIQNLQAEGMIPAGIAAAAGTNPQAVLEFITPSPGKGRGRKQRTTPEMAARILAVTVETAAARAHRVAATGTIRRIQGLVALGWPLKTIAAHAELHAAVPSEVLKRAHSGHTVVFGETERKIKAAYDTLRAVRPERRGVPKGLITRSKNWARANRWPKPTYWDKHPGAIDDPFFTPDYGLTKADILAEETRWLIHTAGLTRSEVAERLGKDRSYIDRVLGQADLKAAA
ncbi:hypothetical protein [Streptomyces sp. A-14]|uniref:hypothetical protein n=1 Tax=Streptomyces sp. A-14 TaxID=3127467 RepID=UPI003EC12A26